MVPLEAFTSVPIKLAALISRARSPLQVPEASERARKKRAPASNAIRKSPLMLLTCQLILAPLALASAGWYSPRHQSHYMNIVPSTHFRYSEGRQAASAEQGRESVQLNKRSSALVVAPPASFVAPPAALHYAPLVGSSHSAGPFAAMSRRMMADAGQARGWLSASELAESDQLGSASELDPQSMSIEQQVGLDARRPREQLEQMERQKQHIQYHDQWLGAPASSSRAKCHKRTLNFCASVLPFNTTTFPNIIGDTNRFEVKRSLPFFGFLAKSSCNKRLDQLLCLLLEPPCHAHTGQAIPPCKKFCRLALEGCNEYIPATLALSSVFDCRQYPDSNEPDTCINLAQGSQCAPDEFKCPDKTCIPRNWLCDGVRDCIFAADEANCTESQGSQPATSVCSTEEFKCDGKCVPKAWKCDGERDCLDGSDEESCDLRPRCGPDRFKCLDGNGCIPKRWVCDGKAECRDGSDETNCEQRECSDSDFKCDNGICIPKLWLCDRQHDCKDGSDERACVYPAANGTAASVAPTSAAPTTTLSERPASEQPEEESAGQQVDGSQAQSPEPAQPLTAINHDAVKQADYYSTSDLASSAGKPDRERIEASLGADIARTIQREIQQQEVASVRPPSSTSPTTTTSPALVDERELKKFDYDIIPSAVPNPTSQPRQQLTQIDFAPQQVGRAQPQPQPQQQPQFQPQRLANERVPIYRSLFKTLKAGPSKLQVAGAVGGPAQQPHQHQPQAHRYAVVASRRRRDRNPVPEVGLDHQQALNVTKPGQHGVASYLQLLNSRYNLRLARVANQKSPQTGKAPAR